MNMSKNITIEHFKNYLRTLTAYKTLMQRITAGEIQVEDPLVQYFKKIDSRSQPSYITAIWPLALLLGHF
jgi:butyrate kinase